MKQTVDKGKALLVDGPASVSLLSGEAEVLGSAFKVGDKVVIREGKRMSFEVRKRATFDLMLGDEASFQEVDESTIPPSWENAYEKIISGGKPLTVMVMGGVDSGKTSFCTYLANKALKRKRKVAIIDADVGQSDIGPPSTIGFSRITSPIKDLFEVETEDACFVGSTSPSGAIDKVMKGLTTLKAKVLETDVDFLIVNTDGWIEGEDAARYKVWLTEIVAPNVVVGIQQNELTPILTELKEVPVLSIDSSLAIRKRDRDKRRVLRELSYKKYLKGAKVLSLPLGWVKVEGAPIGTSGLVTAEQVERVRALLDTSIVYCEETVNAVFVVLRKDHWVDEERLKKLEEQFKKRVKIVREGEEEGLLVALQDVRGSFLGIGVLCEVDYERRMLKIYTPVSTNVSIICFGQIKLDKQGKETGLSTIFSNCLP